MRVVLQGAKEGEGMTRAYSLLCCVPATIVNMGAETTQPYPPLCRIEERRGTAFVELNKKEGCGLGLVLSGGLDKNTKPQISYLRPGGIAQRSDALEVGDYIVSVNGIRTALLRHEEIVNLLKNAGGSVVLEVEYELPDPPQECASVLHKRIEVHVEKEGQAYGFTLRGGLNTDSAKCRPLTVTQIRPGSSADRESTLKVGDRILMINGVNASQKTLSDAQALLARPQSSVHLVVEYDVSVMEAVQNATGPLLVEIDKTPGSSLGISLTTTSYKGRFIICIESVKPASIADRCGALHVGDHVLAIDETNLEHISVAEATQLLRCGTPEHIKLEILPMRSPSHSKVSELSPRLALSPVRQFPPRSPSPSRSLGSLQSFSTYNSLVNNCAPHHTLPALPSHLPPTAPVNSARSSSLRPGWGLRHRKTSATSLASTATYSTLPTSLALQLYHTEVVEVLLVADHHGYGFTVTAASFPSDVLSEPPVISQVEPNSAAQRSAVIQEGDHLVAINGHFLDGRSLNEINQMLHNSSPKVTLHIEFAVAESVVTTTGTFTVKLAKRCSTLGITISAPTKRKSGDPLVISDVKKGSVAYRTGTIHAGDHLLAIDNVRTDTCSIEAAARLLQQADSVVKLKIRKDDTFSEEQDAAASVTYTVELPKQGGPLGITVSGTEDPFDPIFISGLTKGGLAEKTGALHVADRILAINGETLQGRPLSEAIRMLQLTHAAVTLKITRPTASAKCNNGVAGKAHDSVDSALESWDSSGLDSNNAANGQRAVIKAKRSDTHNEGSGSSGSGKEEPLPTIQCYGPPGGTSGSWRREKPYLDMGDGELHINEDDWSHSSGATCSPSVPLSFSSSNDADEWSSRLYELDQLSSINRCAAKGKPAPEGSTKKPAPSESDAISPSQLDDNANSVLYELDESASNLAYDNGQGALQQNGCLSGASSPDLDDDFGDLPGKSLGAEMHLREVEEQLQNIFTPTPVELFRVVLRKYSSLDDFGFGVSDGIYEKGVFISAIRPGGPADRSGVLNQYDRLLQVNDVRTKELDCNQVVPLIANVGNQVELVLSRNPIAEMKLRQREDYELWEMQPDDGLNVKEV